MSWVKQSDTLWRDYEFMKLTDSAQALWTRALSWTADNLTDGVVPKDALRHLRGRGRSADELVSAGYWIWRESGSYLVRDWQKFVLSKDEVLEKRAEQSQRDSRKSPRQPAASLLPPGPVPQFSPEEEEKKLGALSLSETAPANDRARDRSARFEKPPLPPAPLELPPPERKPDPWLRVWELYADHIGLDVFQLPHASTQERALRAIAASAEVEAGGSQGVGFENAVKRLLGAWNRDKWVQEKQPSIANLAANLHRYAAPKQKPIVKLAPQPADSLMAHWDRLDAMRREEERREDELNAIRCRELLAAADALDRAGGAS